MFSAPGAGEPANLPQWKLEKAGDVETNPGPRKTTRDRPTARVLIGDSLVKGLRDETWNVRAWHGGTWEDLIQWVEQAPHILKGMREVAVLAGGNAVCSRPGSSRTSEEPEDVIRDLYALVRRLQTAGATTIKVLGVPKRRNLEDMNAERVKKGKAPKSPNPEEPDACKPGENTKIVKLNELIQNNARSRGYDYVGVSNFSSGRYFERDGVHLSERGYRLLASTLNRAFDRR